MEQGGPDQRFNVSFDSRYDVYCTACGYNLRGATGSACPECGAGFRLATPERVERYGLYLVALMGTAGLAYAGQYIAYPLADVISDPVTGLGYYMAMDLLLYALYLIAVPYLVLLLVFRKAIVRSGVAARLLWAVPPVVGCLIEVGYTLYQVVFVY